MRFLDVVYEFMCFRTQVKFFHWFTNSYARHEAYDVLESKTSKLVDSLIEVLMSDTILEYGEIPENKYITEESDIKGMSYLQYFLEFLNELREDVPDSAKSIIDEISGHIQQAIYKIKNFK